MAYRASQQQIGRRSARRETTSAARMRPSGQYTQLRCVRVGILRAVAAMPPRIAVQKFVEALRNLRQRSLFAEDFAFDKPLSSKFVEKEFVEGSLKVITTSLT